MFGVIGLDLKLNALTNLFIDLISRNATTTQQIDF